MEQGIKRTQRDYSLAFKLSVVEQNATSESMNTSFDDILKMLDDAAAGGVSRRWAAHMAAVRSEKARAAAQARWGKKKLAA